jgi:hypothetical protein
MIIAPEKTKRTRRANRPKLPHGRPKTFFRHREAAALRSQPMRWSDVARTMNVSIDTIYLHIDEIRSYIDPESKFSRPRAYAKKDGGKAQEGPKRNTEQAA